MTLCNNPNPQDEMQAQVSLHHCVAVAIIRGAARIQDLDTTTAVQDPVRMALQQRRTASLDPSLASDAAIVTVTLVEGARHTCNIEHGIGSAARPMTNDDLETSLPSWRFRSWVSNEPGPSCASVGIWNCCPMPVN